MTQPMSQKEIEVWDAIAIAQINKYTPERAYERATHAISARRAALIADAHVGLPFRDGDSGDWLCMCSVGEYGGRRYKANHDDVEYCEACHTRRPDADDKVTHEKQDCATCKHEECSWEKEPCIDCQFLSKWEAAK